MSGVKDRLSDEDKDVLEMIDRSAKAGPRARDVRDTVEWTEDTRAVHYRFSKLADMGLIEKRKEGDDKMSPVRVFLTDLGADIVDDVDTKEQKSLEERVKVIEDKQEQFRTVYTEVKRRIMEIEDDLDQYDDDLDDLNEDIWGVKRFLDEQLD